MRWHLYSFAPLEPIGRQQRGYACSFVRLPAEPIVIATPTAPKLVTRSSGEVDLVVSSMPFAGAPAELVVWLAERKQKGMEVVSCPSNRS